MCVCVPFNESRVSFDLLCCASVCVSRHVLRAADCDCAVCDCDCAVYDCAVCDCDCAVYDCAVYDCALCDCAVYLCASRQVQLSAQHSLCFCVRHE